MSEEEQIAQVFGTPSQPDEQPDTQDEEVNDTHPEEVIDEQQVDTQVQEEVATPEYTNLEREAIDMGWSPDKDKFIENGGDPEKYVSAHEYVRFGKLQKSTSDKIANIERKFDDQIKNLNKLHNKRLQDEINNLEATKRQAVEDGDVDLYDQTQQKINDAYQSADQSPDQVNVDSQPEKHSSISNWENSNQWINDVNNPKTIVAQSIWNEYATSNPNATPESAIQNLDSRLAKLYPPETNPRRSMPTGTEKGTKAAGKQRTRELSMNDLTPSEMSDWNNFGRKMYSKQKDFLKAVQNSRQS